MRYAKHCLVSLIVVGLAAYESEAKQAAPPAATPFLTKVSIREIMDAEVDPAADALWDAVAIINGKEKHPRTAEEWQALRRSAITLIEATNLIVMDGRRIAPSGAHYRDEADPARLQERLDANRSSFIEMAQVLRTLGLKTLDAIDAKDGKRLFDLGADLDEACEACHLVYYYPKDLEPKH